VTFERLLAASTVPLRPVPCFDRKAPPTSYKVGGADPFRVDLLVPARGAEVTTAPVPELDAHATALPFLAYLLDLPEVGVVLGREVVVPVLLPRPEAFAWHRVLVSQLRGVTREKRGKDLEQAAVLFAVLAEDAPDSIETAFVRLPRGARGPIGRGLASVLARLEAEGHGHAVEVLRPHV
jgi:hypothetical protein